MTPQKSFTITKKIAKHGKQAVIIVPTLLQEKLFPGKLVEIRIEIIADNRTQPRY
jgi:hypothetical protein